MHEQVVGLIVKAPLAHHQACPAVLAQLYHICEVLLLLLAQLLKLLNGVDVNLMWNMDVKRTADYLRAAVKEQQLLAQLLRLLHKKTKEA